MSKFPTTINELGISSCMLAKSAIVTSLHVGDDLIAITLNNGSIHLFNPDGSHLTELRAEKPSCLWALAVKDNILIAGGTDGKLQMWDLETRYGILYSIS